MKCPYCAEEIKDEGRKCRYCGEWIVKKNFVEEKDTSGSLKDISTNICQGTGNEFPIASNVKQEDKSKREWHYEDGKDIKGPISESHLRELLQKRIVDSGTLICAHGMDDWKKASDVFPEYNSPSVLSAPIPQQQKDSKTDPFRPSFKRVPIILVIIYTFITGGIYIAVWFLTRRGEINKLESDRKLGMGIFIFLMVMSSLYLALRVWLDLVGFSGGGLLGMVPIIYCFIYLFQCFKVRRIFQDHFNKHLNLSIKFSGVALFFFQIYYLQYKINRFN